MTLAGGKLNIFHLLFIDDSLLLCESKHNQLCTVKAILLCFEVAPSLKVSLTKLEIILVGNVHNTYYLSNIFDHKVSTLPLNYLGLSLGLVPRSVAIWDTMIEKITCRLKVRRDSTYQRAV